MQELQANMLFIAHIMLVIFLINNVNLLANQ
jgi:hypothetical protein